MSERLSYIEFRREHPGVSKAVISDAWGAYKSNDLDAYKSAFDDTDYTPREDLFTAPETEDTTVEETTSDSEPEPVVEPAEEKTKKPVKEIVKKLVKKPKSEKQVANSDELSLVEMMKKYNTASQRLLKWGVSMTDEQRDEAHQILKVYAKKTLDHVNPRYKCTDTDAWEVWMGQKAWCILQNSTQGFAFECTRAWWKKYYNSAKYVHLHTFSEPNRLDEKRQLLLKRKRYINRPPLPGVEIMVPTTARDFHKRE